MYKSVRDKWVAALRSGEYRQCKVWWEDPDDPSCCCAVGILFKLYRKEVVLSPAQMFADFPLLDPGFRAWIGSPKLTGMFESASGLPALGRDLILIVGYNEAGKTFDELATLIEEHIPVIDDTAPVQTEALLEPALV